MTSESRRRGIAMFDANNARDGLRVVREFADGRVQYACIGCGTFLRIDSNWNQCGDCDTRYPEEQ
jgi:hypothetical protein